VICPCPRCLVKKHDIGALGTAVDIQRRQHVRVDNRKRQRDIDAARSWIFEKGRGISSTYHVENILKPTSMIPTRVSNHKSLHKCIS
jgi:hypothetical protein